MRKSTNQNNMKERNRRLVLDLIRRGGYARADLAHATGLTRASVTVIVDGLLAEGLVNEAGSKRSGVGRAGTVLEICPGARAVAGVNITRRATQVGLVNLGGEILCQTTINSAGVPPAQVLEEACTALRDMQTQCALPQAKLLGVGISAPGPLDYRAGVLHSPTGFGQWRGVHLVQAFNGMQLPVQVENVSDSLALEEKYFGEHTGTANMMVVVVDDGIGAGILVQDRIYRGAGGFGGEIGHISIRYDGIPCECGNVGCLERYASMPALLQGSGFASWQAVVDAAGSDARAQELVEREAEYLSAAIVSATNLFDLEKVLLGGDVSYRPQKLLERVNALVRGRLSTPARGAEEFVCATPRTHGVRTAAMPVLHRFYGG